MGKGGRKKKRVNVKVKSKRVKEKEKGKRICVSICLGKREILELYT